MSNIPVELLELPTATPTAGSLASPLLVKGGLLSVALHVGAIGAVVLSSGLYEAARIGARGGPMSIEAINAPESLGELSKGQIVKERMPTLEDDPLLESALAVPATPPPDTPQVEVAHDPPPLPNLDEPLMARLEPKPNPEVAQPPKPPSPPQEQTEKVATATAAKQDTAPTETADNSKPRAAASSRPSAGSLGHNGNEGYSSPRFADNAPITYPPEAVAAHLEGEVLLRLHIAATGQVTAVEIVRPSGHPVLDRTAAEAVRSWHADPARLLGQPIATTAVLPVRFHL